MFRSVSYPSPPAVAAGTGRLNDFLIKQVNSLYPVHQLNKPNAPGKALWTLVDVS